MSHCKFQQRARLTRDHTKILHLLCKFTNICFLDSSPRSHAATRNSQLRRHDQRHKAKKKKEREWERDDEHGQRSSAAVGRSIHGSIKGSSKAPIPRRLGRVRGPVRLGPAALSAHPVRAGTRRPARVGQPHLALRPDLRPPRSAHRRPPERPLHQPLRPPDALHQRGRRIDRRRRLGHRPLRRYRVDSR